ncbi:hypothetical protein J709_0282 [Acinetobacter baumannii 7893]|nr:hypothetical protein J469_2984 [Acinetobacter baumannii 1046051]EXD08029.1 hypothetical protein J496_0156 [Acinetobacter baumannii 1247182]EXD44629.1 hypothetical protein J476_1981 [Acinetobacter baumannii 532413]EXG71415.1 hypothetical protein J709_0282 [Acinetobacter baumannii 7893]EXI43335.1 hypothetical protein J607_0038 [Acinetobacter baumannii 923118]EXS05532.1 hypothetical protein J698_0038 [Acinetobacter baumannii 1494580]KCW32452.1 hypothetical protein J474_0475 [Acinetobacter bau
MGRNQTNWLLIVLLIMLVFLGVGFSIFNSIEVCKTHDIYWVNGTQYSCAWVK